MNRSFIPRKNQIILAILAMSLLADQPMIAQDKSQSGAASRIKKEYQAFKKAFACARQKGFRACSLEQKARIVAAGAALLVVIGSMIYSGTRIREFARLRYYGWGYSRTTPLHLAIERDDTETAKKLIATAKYADVNARDVDGVTPLFVAIYRRKNELARLLIEKGADVKVNIGLGYMVPGGFTPLGLAVGIQNIELILLLIEKGADVNEVNEMEQGYTHLHWAAGFESAEVARLLIENGADVNAKQDRWGFTPLHRAANFGRYEVARLLIEKGADVNAKYDTGPYETYMTPLHGAAQEGHVEVTKLLIQKGADLFAKNMQGQMPLDVAKNKEIKDLIQSEIDFRMALGERALQEKFEEAFERVEKRAGRAPELEEKILGYAFPEEAERRAKQRKAGVEKRAEGQK